MSGMSINQQQVERTVALCKERNIIIPTFAQGKNPQKVPAAIRKQLKDVGLWDVNSLNLFRITWKNDVDSGGFGRVNFVTGRRKQINIHAMPDDAHFF